ncbi:MAG: methylenetetrahydrofolate--tRNA-(uracil(54)-C(5))-methyltransferase (FADH(2)-oxidizing) TrmFO, partial [Oscillospiraceae bacterium]
AHFVYDKIMGKTPLDLPQTTMCGALLNYITTQNKDFQPMGANIGILPPLEENIRDKRERYLQVSNRAVKDLENIL